MQLNYPQHWQVARDLARQQNLLHLLNQKLSTF